MRALLPLIAQSGFNDGHMGGFGWVAVVAMVVMMGGMGWMMLSMMRKPKDDGASLPEGPIEVLRRRYAAGDLSTEEFQERLRAIEETQP